MYKRQLEAVATKYGEVRACSGDTDIFIYPGYHYKAIDLSLIHISFEAKPATAEELREVHRNKTGMLINAAAQLGAVAASADDIQRQEMCIRDRYSAVRTPLCFPPETSWRRQRAAPKAQSCFPASRIV